MSCLSEHFHRAVHYGKKILHARDHISLTDKKISKANLDVDDERRQWNDLPREEIAYMIYELMIDRDGKSRLKAIVAQCLASILRWEISVIPSGFKQEKMFDLDLYSLKTDEQKKLELRSRIEGDEFLSYIVNAIKYAAGESV